tara:strand:+ start:346 stop:1542 length:1197 start_codon:yes stop_codon:yes gene_type:complete
MQENTKTEEIEEMKDDGSEEFKSFDDMELDDCLLRGIYAYGFEKPSYIQMRAIVPFSRGRDLIAQAQSGTGKTATFLIGVLQKIHKEVGKKTKPQAIIVAPTRELAQQIFMVCNHLSKYMKVLSHCAIGGTSVYDDIRSLEKGVHIVIGTPGRILHLCSKKYLDTGSVKTIILDEVDEIFSTGFKDQIYDIFQFLPEECQVGLFSATMQDVTLELSKKILRNPVKVFVKNEEVTLQGISQFYIDVKKDYYKFETLLDIYDKLTISQTIIYLNSKKQAEILSENLEKNGHSVSCIHSNLSQKERESVIKAYRRGESRILIATDIIARGIDVQQVSIVINYDLPREKDTYIHRIGRSGRFGRKGIAINLVSSSDYEMLQTIEKYYATEISEMPLNIDHYL